MAKKEEINFIIQVSDSSNLAETSQASLPLSLEKHKSKSNSSCLSPDAPHSITWSNNLSNSSSQIQSDSKLSHPHLSNSFSGITGLAAAFTPGNASFKREINCSKASLSSMVNSSEGSLCVHAPSLPTLEGFRELDASGNISQCNFNDNNSGRVLEEALPASISCPSLVSVGIVPSSSSRRLLLMPNVPRANSTFNMPAGEDTPDKFTAKQNYKFNQKTLFGMNYPHGQCCQMIGKSSLSPYLVRKTFRSRPPTSSGVAAAGNASPSIIFPSNYKRKCEDWLVDKGPNP